MMMTVVCFVVLATSVHSVHFLKIRTCLFIGSKVYSWKPKTCLSVQISGLLTAVPESRLTSREYCISVSKVSAVSHYLPRPRHDTKRHKRKDWASSELSCKIFYLFYLLKFADRVNGYLDSQALPIKHCKM
jgi:hypothetical protein